MLLCRCRRQYGRFRAHQDVDQGSVRTYMWIRRESARGARGASRLVPAIVMEVGLTSGERRSDELLLQRSKKRIDSVEGSRFYSISKVDLKRSRCVAQHSRSGAPGQWHSDQTASRNRKQRRTGRFQMSAKVHGSDLHRWRSQVPASRGDD